MSSSVNLDKLDLDGLLELEKDVQGRIQAKRREYRNEIKAQIRDLMAKADISPSDLDTSSRKGTVKVKYRSKDGANTWTGRGRKPKWVADHLTQGGAMEDLLA